MDRNPILYCRWELHLLNKLERENYLYFPSVIIKVETCSSVSCESEMKMDSLIIRILLKV